MSFNFNMLAFLCLNNLEYANKKCKVNSGMGYNALLELRMFSLNTDMKTDPNINYTILENSVNTLNMCIPIKKNKFNKHKHKKSSWITAGIIKSIKFRDNLYRSVKQISPDCSQYAIMKKKTYQLTTK